MLKGRKLNYAERWADERMLGAPAFSLKDNGKRLRKLAAEIRREHRTRKKDLHNFV